MARSTKAKKRSDAKKRQRESMRFFHEPIRDHRIVSQKLKK